MGWDFDCDRSIYLQIIEHIKVDILSGILQPGDKIDSVRELAKKASVNPNTMQKALSQLEKNGYLYKERTKERFITKDTELIKSTRIELADKMMTNLIQKLNYIGFNNYQIEKMINKKLREDLING